MPLIMGKAESSFENVCGLVAVQVKPSHVLNAAGLTGRPNVDWCEDHKVCPPLDLV